MMHTGREFYDNLEKIAWSRGMSIHALAAESGISPTNLSRLKYNRANDLYMKTCIKLADALHCSVNDLITPWQEEEQQTAPRKSKLDSFMEDADQALRDRKEIRRLMRVALKASKKQINSVAALLETIVENANDQNEETVD